MKKAFLSVCVVALISVFQISCKKDDFQPNKKEGTVEFGFALKAPSNSGVQKSSIKAPAAEPASVVVTIKRVNGTSAYTMEKIDLYNMNGYYISKPLSLLPGNYTVDQFFVVDASGSVMYASPVQGSPKAYLVSKPLPISFTVGKDVVTKVVPEVLSTANSTPEDFGYTTFSFDVVKTFDFLIGVFVYNESALNFELTSAHLTVAAVNKTIYTDTLAAITNKVTLNDGYDNYLLTVTKDGYKTWTDTLTAAELKLYFRSEDRGPLKVILEKCENCNCQMGSVTDIDGNIYKTVKIGNQWWMIENLRVTRYRNGDSINTGLIDNQWVNTKSGAFAIYPHADAIGINSDEEMLEAYGALYNWYAVDDSRGLSPEGWRIPSKNDWKQLMDYLMNEHSLSNEWNDLNGIGNKLKSCRQVSSPLGDGCASSEHPRWDFDETHYGNDYFCFNALPAGVRGFYGFGYLGYHVSFWSSTGTYYETAFFMQITKESGHLAGSDNVARFSGISVRCVRDN